MLREYELTVITKADLPEAEQTKLLGKYEKLMTADGGQILKKDPWGVRKIAFPINKQFRGYYINYDFIGASKNLAEMERLMGIDEDVLRHMSVFIGKDVDVVQRKEQLAKIAAASRQSHAFDDRDGRDMQ